MLDSGRDGGGGQASSGVSVHELRAGEFLKSKKMILLRQVMLADNNFS